MKIIHKQNIDNYSIIKNISEAIIDAEMTKKKISNMITNNMTEDQIDRLYFDNLVYAKVGHESELVEDSAANVLQQKLNEKNEQQLLLASGEYIIDLRGEEYWIKNKGEWKKEKIEKIGLTLPKNAVKQEEIPIEIKKEIDAQQEEKRIAGLSPEELTREKIAKYQTQLHQIDEEAGAGRKFRKVAIDSGILADVLRDMVIKMASLLHEQNPEINEFDPEKNPILQTLIFYDPKTNVELEGSEICKGIKQLENEAIAIRELLDPLLET